MVKPRGAILITLWVGALLLGGCSIMPGAGKGEISFREIFESRSGDELLIERTVELDVDEDGDDEWLVLYRFDPTRRTEWDNTPMHGVVYDAVPCDPPVIVNWRLPVLANDFLGMGSNIRAYMADWLASPVPGEADNELIVEGPGPVNTLTIFRYHDYQRDPCKPPNPDQQGFEALGYFRANGRIVWDEETQTVTTLQQTAFERSQLAIRSIYSPRSTPEGETFLTDAGAPIKPNEQTVDFLYSQPISPVDSPFPEKAVAAFYLSLGIENERAKSFLTEELAREFEVRTWGLDYTPGRIKRALIYSISYSPDREAELLHLEREITLVVAAVDQNNQRLPPRRVTWRVKGFPFTNEDNRPDCEWRLAEIKSVIVTDGLGMLLPGER